MKYRANPQDYRAHYTMPSLFQLTPWLRALLVFMVTAVAVNTAIPADRRFYFLFPLILAMAAVFLYDFARWFSAVVFYPHAPYAEITEIAILPHGIRLIVTPSRYQEIGWGGVVRVAQQRGRWMVSFRGLPDLVIPDAGLSADERCILTEHHHQDRMLPQPPSRTAGGCS